MGFIRWLTSNEQNYLVTAIKCGDLIALFSIILHYPISSDLWNTFPFFFLVNILCIWLCNNFRSINLRNMFLSRLPNTLIGVCGRVIVAAILLTQGKFHLSREKHGLTLFYALQTPHAYKFIINIYHPVFIRYFSRCGGPHAGFYVGGSSTHCSVTFF